MFLPHVESVHVPPISAATPPLSPQSVMASPHHTPVQTHHHPASTPHQHQLPSYQLPPPIVQYQQALPSISGVMQHQTAIHPHAAAYPNGSPSLYPTPYSGTSPASQSVRYERILPKNDPQSSPSGASAAVSATGSSITTSMPPPSNPLTPSVTFSTTSPYPHPVYAAPPSPHYTLLPPQASPHLQPTIHSPPALRGTEPKASTADQRELLRKVSHSAIERRRRERINDKILQLKQLVPSCADQDHLHKLSILQSAIEYIRYLQGLNDPKLVGGQTAQGGGIKKEPSSASASSGSTAAPSPSATMTSYTSQFPIKPEHHNGISVSPPPPLSIPSPALAPTASSYTMPPPPPPATAHHSDSPGSSPSSSVCSSAATSPALLPSASDHEEATGGLLMLSAAVSAQLGATAHKSAEDNTNPAARTNQQPWTVTTALRPKDVVAEAEEERGREKEKERERVTSSGSVSPREMSVGSLLCS